MRVAGDGTQTVEPIFQLDSSGNVVARSVDLGSDTDRVFLTLYGTAFREAGASSVKVAVGGIDVPVLGAAALGQYPGFDQINIGPLPRSLRGSGDVVIQVTAASIPTNATYMTFQ